MKTRIGEITLTTVLCLLAAFTIWAVYAFTVRAEPVDTYHSSWKLVRETADEDGASFAAVYNLTTSGNWANKDSSSVASGGPFHIVPRPSDLGTEGQSAASWMFAICGKDFNNVDDTFSFDVVGWAQDNGPAQVICTGNGVLGTQAVVVYPDGGDALGELASETAVVYTHAQTKFTVTNEGFDGAVAGMLAYITGTNITSGYYQITTATDANNIVMSGITASGNNTDSTVQINPAFWADTIAIDANTTWPSVAVKNSGNNSIGLLLIDTCGIEWIQFVIYDADGESGDEAGEITVYGREY
jgi:hypothetical protein